MGLAICVGYQADLKQGDEEGYGWAREMFALVNQALEAEGQKTWEEPDTLGSLGMRCHVGSFPYSFLHYLRRAYMWTREFPGEPLPPTDKISEADDQRVADLGFSFDSHLLCHSDCEGVYVPVDFEDPVFSDLKGVVGGGIIGSSWGLLRELHQVAPLLGIKMDPGPVQHALSGAEAERLFDTPESDGFEREKVVFLALWEAARASVIHKSAIVFS